MLENIHVLCSFVQPYNVQNMYFRQYVASASKFATGKRAISYIWYFINITITQWTTIKHRLWVKNPWIHSKFTSTQMNIKIAGYSPHVILTCDYPRIPEKNTIFYHVMSEVIFLCISCQKKKKIQKWKISLRSLPWKRELNCAVAT